MPDLSVAEQRQHLRTWLGRRGAGDQVTFRETHVSILAFTPERVWKCKKAVRLPFVDLSTEALRRANCEREVALNRRLAPDVYLGVVPLESDDGRVVDHLVEMVHLADDRRLSTLVEVDAVAGSRCVDAVADLLVAFHAKARTGGDVDRAGTVPELETLWLRSLAELQPFAGTVFDPPVVGQIERDVRNYLAGRSALFDDRIAARKIRDGHGDLLADDVFCLSDGPRVLDCLEFDDALRYGDVLADVAFLAMDLERLGRPDLSRRFLDRYRDGSGDVWPASVEDFYVAYRALVRAKVACLRVADDAGAAPEARALLALAARHLAHGRVRLVLIGGPPATGKTTAARALAQATGWEAFHSDEVRKELAGMEPTESGAAPLDRGLYAEVWSERTYGALLDRARAQLERGTSVILDASWSVAARRSEAERLATATASELTSFVCRVAPAVADERAAARARRGTDASDALPPIAADLRARFAPWPGAVTVEGNAASDQVVRQMLGGLGLGAIEE